MKTIKSIKTLSLALLFALIAGPSFGQDLKAQYNIDDSKIALQGYSAVSYLDLGIAQKGLKQFKSVYEELSFYFTSVEQKVKFDANPKKYLPQYGGFCAFGISVGAKFRTDPNKFVVKGDKYYLYLYDVEVDAQQLWLAGNHKELVSTANDNWKTLSKTK